MLTNYGDRKTTLLAMIEKILTTTITIHATVTFTHIKSWHRASEADAEHNALM